MNVLPIALIGLVAALLAFDKRYEDGLIRHVSLAGMVAGSVIIVLGDWFGEFEYEFPWEVSLIIWAWAIFFVCHAYSFIRWRLTGSNAWTKTKTE